MTTPPANQPDPKTDPPAGDPPPSDAEKGFWEKLDKAVEAAADRVVEKRLREVRGTGTQRTEGRSTLPGWVADFVFGKDK